MSATNIKKSDTPKADTVQMMVASTWNSVYDLVKQCEKLERELSDAERIWHLWRIEVGCQDESIVEHCRELRGRAEKAEAQVMELQAATIPKVEESRIILDKLLAIVDPLIAENDKLREELQAATKPDITWKSGPTTWTLENRASPRGFVHVNGPEITAMEACLIHLNMVPKYYDVIEVLAVITKLREELK